MKAIKIIFGVFMALFIGVAVETTLGLNAYAVAGALSASSYVLPYVVPNLAGMTFMAVSPDVSKIAGYAGDHRGDLFRKMLFGMEAAKHLTVLPNVKDRTPLLSLQVTKGLRPYNSNKQFESSLEYNKRMLVTGLGKKELKVDVQKYRDTYLSKYLDPSAHSKKIPFAQFTNEAIIEEFGEEINESVIYYGLDKSRFTPWTSGLVSAVGDLVVFTPSGASAANYYEVVTITTAGESPATAPAKYVDVTSRAVADGFQVLINEAITDGDLTATTVGEIDNATVFAVAAFKTVYRALDNAYRRKTAFAYCSFNTFDLLTDDIEEKQKYTVTDPSTNEVMEHAIYVPGTNQKLIAVACGWMGDSERIIVSPKENMILGCDILSDANKIAINPDLWEDEMGLLFNPGVNFALAAAVAINDRD